MNLLTFDYLYIEIEGAGYRSVDRESCSYELTVVVGINKVIISDLSGHCLSVGYNGA